MDSVPDTAIRIEVTISAALLQLLGFGDRVPEAERLAAQRDPVGPSTGRSEACDVDARQGRLDEVQSGESKMEGAEWREILLRQDGQRPLAFRGMPLFGCQRQDSLVNGRFEQRMTFYLADDGSVYAGLAFDPDEWTGARPAHRCRHIDDPDALADLIREWQPEGCFHPGSIADGSASPDPSDGARAVRSSFNAMMTECLRTGFLQA